MLPKMEQAKK